MAKWQVPMRKNFDFSRKCDCVHYIYHSEHTYTYYAGGLNLVPNYEFDATLRYENYYRGGSSVSFMLIDDANNRYSVFLSDFTDMLPHMTGGVIKGKFTFVKKGTNYGIKLVV